MLQQIVNYSRYTTISAKIYKNKDTGEERISCLAFDDEEHFDIPFFKYEENMKYEYLYTYYYRKTAGCEYNRIKFLKAMWVLSDNYRQEFVWDMNEYGYILGNNIFGGTYDSCYLSYLSYYTRKLYTNYHTHPGDDGLYPSDEDFDTTREYWDIAYLLTMEGIVEYGFLRENDKYYQYYQTCCESIDDSDKIFARNWKVYDIHLKRIHWE